jgi:hypothetical protein
MQVVAKRTRRRGRSRLEYRRHVRSLVRRQRHLRHDPDEDGRSNLLEYAFNSDPQVFDGPGLPGSLVVELEGGNHLAIRFRRVTAASDIIYQVESSADLGEWQTGSAYSDSGETPVTEATTEVSREGDGLQTLIVRDNQPIGGGAGFLRMKVTRPADSVR